MADARNLPAYQAGVLAGKVNSLGSDARTLGALAGVMAPGGHAITVDRMADDLREMSERLYEVALSLTKEATRDA